MIRILTENWQYKLLALGLASSIWLGLVEEGELATSVMAPIQYRNIPKDLEMSSDVSDRVHLEVRGPATRLRSSMLADTVILLDLASVDRAGERTFPIGEFNTQLPSGVKIDRAVPSQLRMRFERRLSREVPVSIRIGRQPRPGYEIVMQRAEPERLAIVGPESRVQQLDHVEIDALDLADIEGPRQFEVNAYIPDSQVRFERGGKVTVRVDIKKTNGAGQ